MSRRFGEPHMPAQRDLRPVSHETQFRVLEYNSRLPELDLHDVRVENVENRIFDFFRDQHEKNIRNVRIVFGRGGAGALRREVERVLKEDKARPANVRFVEDYSFSSADQAGSIVVIMGE